MNSLQNVKSDKEQGETKENLSERTRHNIERAAQCILREFDSKGDARRQIKAGGPTSEVLHSSTFLTK